MRWVCAIAMFAGGCAGFAGIGDPAALAPDAPAVPCTFGSIDLCLYAAPQNALVIGAPLVISTDRDCDIIYNHPIGRSACVLYARSIEINAKLSARGTRPLILAATEQLDVSGGVDVSSGTLMNSTFSGAAANDRDCVGNTVVAAGPGGSFAGKGGDGGMSSANALAIAAPAIPAPDFLRGGCGGGGANGDQTGGGFGSSAGSGGAVALVAGGAVTIGPAGQVLANGLGGGGGYEGLLPAGGGGSGGMIVLTAPSITVAGTVVANGGGGGEGADSSGAANTGTRGADGTLTAMPASGGTGHPNGGDGGAGGAGATSNGGSGVAGANTSIYGDGAGGGGVGFILVTGELAVTGTLSPTATRLQ